MSEDNVVQVWQPSRRIWAGEEVQVGEAELEGDAMEGVESTTAKMDGSSSAGAVKP